MSALQLSDELLEKCTEKFKQVVIFGAPDLPHNKRQHLIPKFNFAVSMIFARDFPVNLVTFAPETGKVLGSSPAASKLTVAKGRAEVEATDGSRMRAQQLDAGASRG